MTDIYIFKNEKNFKIKVQETSQMGFDLVKNKLQELDFITHVPFTKSFIFHFNHLADVMLHLDNQNIVYQFVTRTNSQIMDKKPNEENSENTPRKAYRKKEFVDGKFKVVYKTVEIREHKDGFYLIEMEWNNEINDFIKTIDEESRYFDSDLRVWKITKPFLNDFVKAVDRAGLKYAIHYLL